MKNIIFILAFMLTGAFAFANTSEVKEVEIKNILIEKVAIENSKSEENQSKSKKILGCTHVTLSCGVEYYICNFKGTTKQLINMAISDNNDVCGTDIGLL